LVPSAVLIWINAEGTFPPSDGASIEEAEMRYRVTLVLARCREFPGGDPRRGYELLVPLKEDRRLDLEAWKGRRHGNPVRRFSSGFGEAWGELRWFLAFGHGEAGEEAFIAEDDGSFALGEEVPIIEWDGQVRIFRVVALAPELPSAGKAA
jgi:hypothetical protein